MKLLPLLLVPLLVLSLLAACGDDDDDDVQVTPTDTPAATDGAGTETPAETDGEATTPAEPPSDGELTEEQITATEQFLSGEGYDGTTYEVTEPASCMEITEQIDTGDSEINDFIGENLVCLLTTGAEFEDEQVRIPFGPYASEVIGQAVLEEQGGEWTVVAIEDVPAP